MRGKIDISKIAVLIVFASFTGLIFGQIMESGEITFERRTNLEKRFEGSKQMGGFSKKWLKEPKIDEFILYFNSSSALFKPVPPALEDEDREWATMQNTTYQDLSSGVMKREFSFYGTSVFLNDSVKDRTWIITENSRDIAGFKTRQAYWDANDTTRIYAWYSDQLVPSVGPESFSGLPGTILGLAIEDGGVVYFAKDVKPLSKTDFKSMMPKGKEKNTYDGEEGLKEMIDKVIIARIGKESLGRTLDDFYVW